MHKIIERLSSQLGCGEVEYCKRYSNDRDGLYHVSHKDTVGKVAVDNTHNRWNRVHTVLAHHPRVKSRGFVVHDCLRVDYRPVDRNNNEVKDNANCVEEMVLCLQFTILGKTWHLRAPHRANQATSLHMQGPVRKVSE